jgi:hypothetical protein
LFMMCSNKANIAGRVNRDCPGEESSKEIKGLHEGMQQQMKVFG